MRFNFFFFLLVTLFVLGFSQTVFVSQATTVFADVLSPVQKVFFGIFTHTSENEQTKKIEDENRTLIKQLVDRNSYVSDIQALKDQFQVAFPKSRNLLPAYIVGAPHFIPGVTTPESFIINRGKSDGVLVGQAVIVKDNLLGKIVEVSRHLSRVDVITNASSSLTVKTSKTDAIGVVKGKGNEEMILDNVLLSDELRISDVVVTRGDLDISGTGIPADLIVGKVTSVDKKPSALFQTASIKSILNFSGLSAVYIVIQNE